MELCNHIVHRSEEKLKMDYLNINVEKLEKYGKLTSEKERSNEDYGRN